MPKQSGRSYPSVSLRDALKIAQAIKEKNGGNPWAPEQVATAVNTTKASTNFFYQTSASQSFGLTKGTREAKKIELDTLGKGIVYAASPEIEMDLKRKAFFNVEIFKKVFDYYGGSKLPESKYLSNTLESEFQIPPSKHEEFVKLFKDNCDYLDLESGNSVTKQLSPDTSESTETIVLSESKNADAHEIFVIMPFSERDEKHANGFFIEVLNSLVIPAADQAGFSVKTAKREGSDVIQSTIVKALIDADLVVADLTEHNPNVLFELGVRLALEKPVLLIRAKGTDKIFDVDNMLRVFDYNPNLWTSTIKPDLDELSKHIKAAWENRSEKSYLKILRGK